MHWCMVRIPIETISLLLWAMGKEVYQVCNAVMQASRLLLVVACTTAHLQACSACRMSDVRKSNGYVCPP